jgi:hypothetical protein
LRLRVWGQFERRPVLTKEGSQEQGDPMTAQFRGTSRGTAHGSIDDTSRISECGDRFVDDSRGSYPVLQIAESPISVHGMAVLQNVATGLWMHNQRHLATAVLRNLQCIVSDGSSKSTAAANDADERTTIRMIHSNGVSSISMSDEEWNAVLTLSCKESVHCSMMNCLFGGSGAAHSACGHMNDCERNVEEIAAGFEHRTRLLLDALSRHSHRRLSAVAIKMINSRASFSSCSECHDENKRRLLSRRTDLSEHRCLLRIFIPMTSATTRSDTPVGILFIEIDLQQQRRGNNDFMNFRTWLFDHSSSSNNCDISHFSSKRIRHALPLFPAAHPLLHMLMENDDLVNGFTRLHSATSDFFIETLQSVLRQLLPLRNRHTNRGEENFPQTRKLWSTESDEESFESESLGESVNSSVENRSSILRPQTPDLDVWLTSLGRLHNSMAWILLYSTSKTDITCENEYRGKSRSQMQSSIIEGIRSQLLVSVPIKLPMSLFSTDYARSALAGATERRSIAELKESTDVERLLEYLRRQCNANATGPVGLPGSENDSDAQISLSSRAEHRATVVTIRREGEGRHESKTRTPIELKVNNNRRDEVASLVENDDEILHKVAKNRKHGPRWALVAEIPAALLSHARTATPDAVAPSNVSTTAPISQCTFLAEMPDTSELSSLMSSSPSAAFSRIKSSLKFNALITCMSVAEITGKSHTRVSVDSATLQKTVTEYMRMLVQKAYEDMQSTAAWEKNTRRLLLERQRVHRHSHVLATASAGSLMPDILSFLCHCPSIPLSDLDEHLVEWFHSPVDGGANVNGTENSFKRAPLRMPWVNVMNIIRQKHDDGADGGSLLVNGDSGAGCDDSSGGEERNEARSHFLLLLPALERNNKLCDANTQIIDSRERSRTLIENLNVNDIHDEEKESGKWSASNEERSTGDTTFVGSRFRATVVFSWTGDAVILQRKRGAVQARVVCATSEDLERLISAFRRGTDNVTASNTGQLIGGDIMEFTLVKNCINNLSRLLGSQGETMGAGSSSAGSGKGRAGALERHAATELQPLHTSESAFDTQQLAGNAEECDLSGGPGRAGIAGSSSMYSSGEENATAAVQWNRTPDGTSGNVPCWVLSGVPCVEERQQQRQSCMVS